MFDAQLEFSLSVTDMAQFLKCEVDHKLLHLTDCIR